MIRLIYSGKNRWEITHDSGRIDKITADDLVLLVKQMKYHVVLVNQEEDK